MREITYGEALHEALREEMLRDPRVILVGEDIGVYGGVFKVTRGLYEEFGPERVRDTPISETAIIGAAIGAAIMGLRPVAEIMYMDFFPICSEQIVNQAAKLYFNSAGQLKVPIVVRTQYALGRGYGSQHSQFFPAWYMHVPGLKLVLPSTPYDAKGLLKTAIRDGNPVLFIECALLYYSIKGNVPEKEYTIPFGKADIKREGDDVTIVAISRVIHEALAAAEMLKERNVSAEVVDPRTLKPLDKRTIINSVEKTGRLVIAEDDCKTSGVGAEIAATVIEEAFDYLDAPILRVASLDTPIPSSKDLEKLYMPNREKILKSVMRIV